MTKDDPSLRRSWRPAAEAALSPRHASAGPIRRLRQPSTRPLGGSPASLRSGRLAVGACCNSVTTASKSSCGPATCCSFPRYRNADTSAVVRLFNRRFLAVRRRSADGSGPPAAQNVEETVGRSADEKPGTWDCCVRLRVLIDSWASERARAPRASRRSKNRQLPSGRCQSTRRRGSNAFAVTNLSAPLMMHLTGCVAPSAQWR